MSQTRDSAYIGFAVSDSGNPSAYRNPGGPDGPRKQLMRIGIFGGSFDPVHTGHLMIAEQCREQARLDEVWFVPSAVAPHKQGGPVASDRQRREMLEFALAGHDHFRCHDIELKRGGTSYTVETLQTLRACQPADEWFLIIGSDSLRGFSSWREPALICQLALPLVYQRPGQTAPLELFEPFVDRERLEQIRAHRIEAVSVEISSTLIRERIAAGKSIRFLVPRAVGKYIEASGLYLPGNR